MITMKTTFLSFIFLLSAIYIKAQDQDLTKFLDDYRITKEIHNEAGGTIHSYDNIEGSPYLYPDYREATIFMDKGLRYHGNLRYDLYSGEMEFQLKGKRYWIAPKEKIEKIILDDKTFVFLTTGKDKKGSFYELITDGPCRLLAKYTVDFIDAEEAKPYQDPRPARFSRKKTLYYIQKEGEEPLFIRNKKNLLSALGDKSSEIASFIRKEHLSVTRKEDLSRIISHYNELLRQ